MSSSEILMAVVLIGGAVGIIVAGIVAGVIAAALVIGAQHENVD